MLKKVRAANAYSCQWLFVNPWFTRSLQCNDREQTSWYFSWWFDRDALTQLTQLAAPGSPDIYLDSMNKLTHPGQTVALATLFEYVVATYGRERLPALLLGLSQHSTWETLIPAVFGVSQTEFEAGWQAYLAVHFSSMALPPLGVSGCPC